jgi:hypothetical protein
MNVLWHFTQRSVGCGRNRFAVRSSTISGSSRDTTCADVRADALGAVAVVAGAFVIGFLRSGARLMATHCT